MEANNSGRWTVLTEIEKLTQKIVDIETTADRVHHLQQEYNRLVDEETSVSPLGDPLEVLPPELWQSLMPDNLDELFILTLVSSRWCHKLLSMRSLWSRIPLDQTIPDYLVKSLLCIHLSRPLKITLEIDLSLGLWREVAPMIRTESTRIRDLSIVKRSHLTMEESLSLLADFGTLPALTHLDIPFTRGPSLKHGINGFRPLEDICYPPRGLSFDNMPALRYARDLSLSAELLRSKVFSKLEDVKIHDLDTEMAAALHNLPYLRVLRFDD
ncbi:hypothetical protein M408DRAFT_28614 [Serendipita vermifera MAFF 305830]|uniref:F-box domain-containing protein n=1 Tax=Serendipita vermifera MAFF 305830 TaxID=933852 RepID=A0A0C2W824_SERVB|nr:hypothetical protein M408DRAFT_28614 [Serendipita vermifera MAFF 305830]